jgi:hypothetical protein
MIVRYMAAAPRIVNKCNTGAKPPTFRKFLKRYYD